MTSYYLGILALREVRDTLHNPRHDAWFPFCQSILFLFLFLYRISYPSSSVISAVPPEAAAATLCRNTSYSPSPARELVSAKVSLLLDNSSKMVITISCFCSHIYDTVYTVRPNFALYFIIL